MKERLDYVFPVKERWENVFPSYAEIEAKIEACHNLIQVSFFPSCHGGSPSVLFQALAQVLYTESMAESL